MSFRNDFYGMVQLKIKKRSGRKTVAGARGDHIILGTVKLNRREPLAIITNLVNASLLSRTSDRTVRY